jgi:competence protein ComEC
MSLRIPITLALIWLYILVAGAPPSAIRAGVVASLVLAALRAPSLARVIGELTTT